MWDFCKSNMRAARKQHKCEYCDFVIEKGEKYLCTSGMYDGTFLSYITCERCNAVIGFLQEKESLYGDEFSDLFQDFLFEYIKCPKCGTRRFDIIDSTKNSIKYECEKCESSGEIDISLNALKNIFKQELEAHNG